MYATAGFAAKSLQVKKKKTILLHFEAGFSGKKKSCPRAECLFLKEDSAELALAQVEAAGSREAAAFLLNSKTGKT